MLKNDVAPLTRALFCCIFALTKNKIFKLKKYNEKQSTIENSMGVPGVLCWEHKCTACGGVCAVS